MQATSLNKYSVDGVENWRDNARKFRPKLSSANKLVPHYKW